MIGTVVAGGPQPAADGEPVLAGQHQVEHEEVVARALEVVVHGRAVGDRLHAEALLGEVALEEVAKAQVVVDDEDALCLGGVDMGAIVAVAALPGRRCVVRRC